MKILRLFLMFVGVFCVFVNFTFADQVEIFSPETTGYANLDLGPNEFGELTIYLKSFGDVLDGYKVSLLNNDAKLVAQSLSDVHGIVIFSKISSGKYRITVNKRMNERGGPTMVSVGDLKLEKFQEIEKLQEVTKPKEEEVDEN